ncbi:hypothetical protein ACFQY9_06150 [Microvirga aerilata]|uniref:hypothetical protein n=1 Tax=Microvirga aerilata TaxID=670292 RepID=UPI0036420113
MPKRHLKLGREGPIEGVLVDETVFEEKLVCRDPCPLGQDSSLMQGFRRVAMMGQEADLDWQRC